MHRVTKLGYRKPKAGRVGHAGCQGVAVAATDVNTRAFTQAPAVVFAFLDQVDFFDGILTDVGQNQVGVAPAVFLPIKVVRVAKTQGVYFIQVARVVGKRIGSGYTISNPAAPVGIERIDPQ